MHWDLDRNLRQDSTKRKAERKARNLDTIQRMVLALIAVWKNRRKKYQISKRVASTHAALAWVGELYDQFKA